MSESLHPAAAPADAAPAAAKYLYCIVRLDRPREFGPVGLAGTRRVYTVHHRDLAAVVSDAAGVAADPTRENVLEHQQVTEVAMREGAVLPVSFGTVVRSEEDVAELLRSRYEPLASRLDRVRDKVEIDLRVLWDRERVAEQVEREDPEIVCILEEIDRNVDTSTYYSRRELDRLLRAAVEAAGNRYAAEVREALRSVSAACQSNSPGADEVLLAAAFLVDRDGVPAFEERVRGLGERFAGVLTFKCGGPCPPYSFASVRVARGD
jgi:hypothetical protein